MASLLAEDRGGANIHVDRSTSLGHATGSFHANHQAHLRAFHEATVVSHQGALKSHVSFFGKLLHHGRPTDADGTSGAQLADVVGL